MGLANMGGSGGIGASLGSTVAKAVKKPSVGRGVGKAVGKTISPRKNSGGGGSRRSIPTPVKRSGGGGNRYSIPEAPGRNGNPPANSTPSLSAYLGTDSVYQNTLRSGKRTLADFLSEIGRRRGEAGTQFNQTKESMERDRIDQLNAIKEEYASRGLIQSGLFGEEQGKFQQQFAQQGQVLEQQQAALLADLLSQEKNFRREQDIALEAARQEAIARRAAKYKIGA